MIRNGFLIPTASIILRNDLRRAEPLLRRLPQLELTGEPLVWRGNLGLRGLKALPVRFGVAPHPHAQRELATVS